jgi:hypothetical protein
VVGVGSGGVPGFIVCRDDAQTGCSHISRADVWVCWWRTRWRSAYSTVPSGHRRSQQADVVRVLRASSYDSEAMPSDELRVAAKNLPRQRW